MAQFGPGASAEVFANQVYRVTIFCHQLDQLGLMVRHYRAGTVTGTVTQGEVAEEFAALFAPDVKALMHSDARYEGVTVQQITPAIVIAQAGANNGAGPGAVGTGALQARQVAGIVTMHTLGAGRSGRGRFYVPFPSSTDNTTGGVPTAGYQANLSTLAATFRLARTVNGQVVGDNVVMTPVLYHRATQLSTAFSGYTVRNRWATQRRRGSYGRTNVLPF